MARMSNERTRIVVICPVYNEADNLNYYLGRLKAVFDALDSTRYQYRLLFTNNRSSDDTLLRIAGLEAEHDWVDHVTLSRNFGYQLSVLCGLIVADADLFMICDVDCEDPPELLSQFLEHIERGRDIAYGIRTNRPDSFLMKVMRRSFYAILRWLGDFTIVPYMAEFSMFRRVVRDAIVAQSSNFPFIRAEIGYVGFDIVGVPYRRELRKYGKSHYGYIRNFKFALSGLLASTTFPLRAALYLLPVVILSSLAMLLLYGFGVMSVEALTIGLLGVNLTYVTSAVAFLSAYVARIYHNVLGRQRFIIDYTRSKVGSAPCSGRT